MTDPLFGVHQIPTGFLTDEGNEVCVPAPVADPETIKAVWAVLEMALDYEYCWSYRKPDHTELVDAVQKLPQEIKDYALGGRWDDADN